MASAIRYDTLPPPFPRREECWNTWRFKKMAEEMTLLRVSCFHFYGEQGWCSAESTRLPPMSPGVCFPHSELSCGSSLLLLLFSALRGFSPGTPVFSSSKSQHLEIPIRSGMLARLIHEPSAPECSHV